MEKIFSGSDRECGVSSRCRIETMVAPAGMGGGVKRCTGVLGQDGWTGQGWGRGRDTGSPGLAPRQGQVGLSHSRTE